MASVLQGIIMIFSKGSIRFQKPKGGLNSWTYNITNLFVLIVITPLVSIFLMKGIVKPISLFSIELPNNSFTITLEIIGLVLFIIGNFFIYITRIFMWNNFRLGAVKPSSSDKLIISGPFKLMRHPMYFAVIIIPFGLALILHSWLFILFFIILFYTIVKMIPIEEKQLLDSYGENYETYRKKVKKIFPYIY